MAGQKDFLDIIRHIRGSAAPGQPLKDGIWYELTVADKNGNPGIYGDILAKYGIVTDSAGTFDQAVAILENLNVEVTTLPAGSEATSALVNGVWQIGLPRGVEGIDGKDGSTPKVAIAYNSGNLKYTVTVDGVVVTNSNILNLDALVDSKVSTNVGVRETLEAKEDVLDAVATAQGLSDSFEANVVAKKQEISTYTNVKINEIGTQVELEKTELDTHVATKVNEYNANTLIKLNQYNNNHINKLSAYNANDTLKLNQYNENHVKRLSEINYAYADRIVEMIKTRNFMGIMDEYVAKTDTHMITFLDTTDANYIYYANGTLLVENVDYTVYDSTTIELTVKANPYDVIIQVNSQLLMSLLISEGVLLDNMLGQPNGVASLNGAGQVPAEQLPSYVDDVLEVETYADLPVEGETGKIYVALDTNKVYRWSGSAYIYITSGAVTLVKSDVGLGNVDNTSDLNKPISTATQNALNNKVEKLSKQSLDSTEALRVSGTTVSLYKGDGTFDSITTQDTIYTLPTATSTVKGGIRIFSDTVQTTAANSVSTTGGRTYGIQLNSAGQAVVNVPWSDTSTVYTHPNSGVTAGTYSKVTVNAQGHITSGASLSASDIPSLDASKITTGTIDAARLPSFVDDVLEFINLSGFPTTGETGKIYVALDTNKTYRWSGSSYVYITSGAVDSVAGKTGVVTLTKSDIGLANVDNTSDTNKPISTATQTALDLKVDKVAGKQLSTEDYTTAEKTKLSGIAAGAQVNVPTDLSLGIATGTTLPLNSSTGTDVVLPAVTTTTAGLMSSTDKTKLDGIATGATKNTGTVTSIETSGAITGGTITSTGTISHSTADGYLHVPATGTTNNGKVLTAGPTAGSFSWVTPTSGVTDHTLLSNIGTNTHAQIDTALTRLANTSGSNTGDNAVNSNYVNDYRASNFIAGTDYLAPNGSAAALTGFPVLNQSTTGNASTATKLQTARTISLSGGVTGSVSFDGSANAIITATVVDDSHNHVISNVDGLQTALDSKANQVTTYTKTEVDTIVGDINSALDTINGEVI